MNAASVIGQLDGLEIGLIYLFPEMILFAGFILIILAGLVAKKSTAYSICSFLALVAIALSALFLLFQWQDMPEESVSIFNGMMVINKIAIAFKALLILSAFLLVLLSPFSKIIEEVKRKPSEYFAFSIAILLGSHILVTSGHFLSAFLSLELVSTGSYLMVNFVFNRKGAEAAVKYLIVGLFSSAIMLYGISYLYGLTGMLQFTDPLFRLRLETAPVLPVIMAVTCTLAGLLFKAGSFPMHSWVPDVYEATPNVIIAYLSVAGKIASLGLLARLAPHIFFPVPGLNWSNVLAILALGGITVGHFSALLQNNVKRMMGYSAIAHTGFMLIPFCSPVFQAEVLLLYLLVYLFMTYAAFFLFERAEHDTFSGLSGQGLTNPLFGLLLVITMISLTGLPPTWGFTAKFLLFLNLWEDIQKTGSPYLWVLLIAALLQTVLALFFYLKAPYFLYFKKTGKVFYTNTGAGWKITACVIALPLLVLFFFSGPVLFFIYEMVK